MNASVVQVEVLVPSLFCFGCSRRFFPGGLAAGFDASTPPPGSVLGPPEPPPELHLVLRQPKSFQPQYSVVGAADEVELMNQADQAGWRKVTIYDHTLYVCPSCRRSRQAPQWERRLI